MGKPTRRLDVKGMLIHVSHYDPGWAGKKDREGAFDSAVALEILEAMGQTGLNLLIIDCADGVKYRSHPELKRHYTVPMRELKKVAEIAHSLGIDVVPKLNFAKSHRNHHDAWMGEHCREHGWPRYDQYYQVAEDLIAELTEVCRPQRFFHIGMDEDHSRSHVQYVAAIEALRRIVKKFALRTVIWNDSCHDDPSSIAQVHAEKSLAAETLIPHDIVQMPWRYGRARPSVIKRLTREGFEVWGAPGSNPENVKRWRKGLLAHGGKGIVLTTWTKCDRAHRKKLLETVRQCGALL